MTLPKKIIGADLKSAPSILEGEFFGGYHSCHIWKLFSCMIVEGTSNPMSSKGDYDARQRNRRDVLG